MSKKAKPVLSNILCIGPKASGKTMLLRKLEDPASEASPIPTVGVNQAQVSLENRTYCIQEIGSALDETWPGYYASAHALIFVIDGVNPGRMAANFVSLMDMLMHPATKGKKVLLLLNKRDLLGHMTAEEIKYTLRLHDIMRECSQQIEVVETSARTCMGFKQIRDWLEKLPPVVV